jgi:uncharacterized protein with GYD domain
MTTYNFVLIQFSTKTTKLLYAGQVQEKEAFTYKVKVMRIHGETSLFAFSDKDNISEIERENIVVKFLRPISSGGTARTTTLKYCSFNLLRK